MTDGLREDTGRLPELWAGGLRVGQAGVAKIPHLVDTGDIPRLWECSAAGAGTMEIQSARDGTAPWGDSWGLSELGARCMLSAQPSNWRRLVRYIPALAPLDPDKPPQLHTQPDDGQEAPGRNGSLP